MDFDESTQKAVDTARGNRWSRRLRRGRVLLVALGVVAASAVSAQALDVCMNYRGGGSYVLKRFKVPSKNKCRPIQGFRDVNFGDTLSGMACTNAAGDELILHYTSHDWEYHTGYVEIATCRATLPIAPGNGGACRGTAMVSPGTGQSPFLQATNLHYCNVDVPN